MKKSALFLGLSIFVVALLFGPYSANSQDYKFHSLFIYNFTKYIEWPESKKSGNFVIGVFGKSDITENLITMAEGKTVGNQKMVISTFSDFASIKLCHIVFVPQAESGKLDEIIYQAELGSALVISERPGLGRRGSAINFIIENGRWRFELNLSAFEKSNLKVASELVKLGKVI